MAWLFLILFVAAAVLAPLFGADSRDGRDWAPNHFWPPRNQPDRAGSPAREGALLSLDSWQPSGKVTPNGHGHGAY